MSPGLSEPYPSQALEEAASRIDYLVSERRRMGVLLGEAGEGKSTILHHVAREQRRRGVRVALVDAVALSPRELLWETASQLGAEPDPGDDLPRLWRRVADQLTHHRWQGESTLMLVDDADQAGADIERQLIRLAGLEAAPDSRWTLIPAAQPARLSNLNSSLLERIDMRVDLFPWSEEDTQGCVQHGLLDAGCDRPVFSDEALARLHVIARGLPRHVARLADFTLVVGAGAGAQEIGPELVEAAFEELRWSPPRRAHLV